MSEVTASKKDTTSKIELATNVDPEVMRRAHAYYGDDYYGRPRFAKYLEYFPGNGPIVDFGCGEGVFLNLARARGREAFGIDYDRVAGDRGRDFGLDIRSLDIFDFVADESNHGRFAGIMMADFVEHFDPHPLQQLLRKCVDILAPDGVIVIITPNSRSLMMNLGGFYESTIEHHNPYSVNGLAKFLSGIGLEIVESGVDRDSRLPVFRGGPLQICRSVALSAMGRVLCGPESVYECSFVVARRSSNEDQHETRYAN